jgi:hypothetical protein
MRGAAIVADGAAVSPASIQLVDALVEIDGADVHRLGHRLVDQVDHELAGGADVGDGVLRGAAAALLDAEHDDRRVVAEVVEEAERGGVVASRVVARVENGARSAAARPCRREACSARRPAARRSLSAWHDLQEFSASTVPAR